MVIRQMGRAAFGGSAGLSMGGPMGAAVGAGIATAAPQIIGSMVSTSGGRALMRYVLSANQGSLDAQTLALFATFLRSQMGSTVQEAGTRQQGEVQIQPQQQAEELLQ
jgi:hypothetical protein